MSATAYDLEKRAWAVFEGDSCVGRMQRTPRKVVARTALLVDLVSAASGEWVGELAGRPLASLVDPRDVRELAIELRASSAKVSAREDDLASPDEAAARCALHELLDAVEDGTCSILTGVHDAVEAGRGRLATIEDERLVVDGARNIRDAVARASDFVDEAAQ